MKMKVELDNGTTIEFEGTQPELEHMLPACMSGVRKIKLPEMESVLPSKHLRKADLNAMENGYDIAKKEVREICRYKAFEDELFIWLFGSENPVKGAV